MQYFNYKRRFELLIQVGVDTVIRKGDCFVNSINDGQLIKAGDTLMLFDIEKIHVADLNPITPVIILNPEKAGAIILSEKAKPGEVKLCLLQYKPSF
jgi:phosphotransferase system IIA component